MKASARSYAIDANFILRFLTRDVEAHWQKAHKAMAKMCEGHIVLCCDPVVLSEVIWTLRSFYKLTVAEVRDLVEPIIKEPGFEIPGKDRYLAALQMYGSSVPDWGDACICAAALEKCEGRVLSFDRDLSRVKEIRRTETP